MGCVPSQGEEGGNTGVGKTPVRALLLVDIQKDFCPGGALAVAGGDRTADVANKLRASNCFGSRVFLTQDWHPASHMSFASVNGRAPFSSVTMKHPDGREYEQTMWPDHCVQGSDGALFLDALDRAEDTDVIVKKGTDTNVDSYSGFFDNDGTSQTELHARLGDAGVSELCIIGIATDVCVHFTITDALKLGYKVYVVLEGCAGLDDAAIQRCIASWRESGASVFDTADEYITHTSFTSGAPDTKT